MIIFFSGNTSREDWPELTMEDDESLGVMLTYHEIHSKNKQTSRRLEELVAREENDRGKVQKRLGIPDKTKSGRKPSRSVSGMDK